MTLPQVDQAVSDACFVLLDDCDATADDPGSRLYTGYLGSLTGDHAHDLPQVLAQMQQALRQGQFAVGIFAYELGGEVHGISARDDGAPLVEILLFAHCEKLSAAAVDAWLQRHSHTDDRAGIADLRASVSEAQFAAALARIHDYVDAGDTYQVNYTYRLHFETYGPALALYRKLRLRQPVPYGALMALPDGRAVLSLSPELFVRLDGDTLTARPMKGTAASTGDPQQDALRAAALAADPKNRAENLMIVDLLRNDLGRVADIGSVRVPSLFDVSRFAAVLQMTSTVQARLRDDVALPELFGALYPCGSITGAPKRRTMQIIRELEPDTRGLYTGAIGWFDAPAAGASLGDFCLSVPIRTLLLDAPDRDGMRAGRMGVGAGIVHDSDAREEYAECLLKARFLTGLAAGFALFETMLATRGGCRYIDLHLRRLQASAVWFNFSWNESALREALDDACTTLPPGVDYRVRLALAQDGTVDITSAPLQPLALPVLPVRLLLATAPTDRHDIFLRHKTTFREHYDAGWRAAESQGAFDMLFLNRDAELTEGGRSNVFIKLDGRWYTPPLAAGVLPGVMRGVLLTDPEWNAAERRLSLDDLRRADDVMVCNALRGVMPAQVVWEAMP
ncbi:MAG: aminodeoxychorismate synthase component I [Herminiimonas sp.]|nr:aminodeoxychorismate synthase component I [Herminiimonas sp.]